MDRIGLIRALTKKSHGAAYQPKGQHLAATGEPSAVKQRKRCEYRRDGNWWGNNYGHSAKTPQEVTAAVLTEKSTAVLALKLRRRHDKHWLNKIADKLDRAKRH